MNSGCASCLGSRGWALKGWPAPEIWTSLHPALALAKSLERHDALTPILWGLFANVLTQGRVAESLQWVQEMLDVAEATGDADLLIAGHMSACVGYTWLGEFTKAVEHANRVLDLYDAEKHRHLVDILNHDPKTMAGIFASMSAWMLGYPDRAMRLSNEKDAHARRRGHAFDLGFALTLGPHKFDHRLTSRTCASAPKNVSGWVGRTACPCSGRCWRPFHMGQALIREGKLAEGIGPLKAGIAVSDASGGKVRGPDLKAFLAEAMAVTGDLDNALDLIDEQIAQIERPGWEERYYYAEILRLKGWMLSLKGDLEGAERNFLASLDWARRQQAKMWELRTSTSLARLWQSQGKRQEAYELLAPVYGWFTEGFDTKDLQDAKALLAEL